MISKKDKLKTWGIYGCRDSRRFWHAYRYSGPVKGTSWGVDGKSHRLYGFQNFSHYFWWVNGKILNNFKKIKG